MINSALIASTTYRVSGSTYEVLTRWYGSTFATSFTTERTGLHCIYDMVQIDNAWSG